MIPVIVVPVLNRFDLLKRCVGSIDYDVEKLIVVNNSGIHEETPYARHVKDAYNYKMPTNLGVAASWNLGIKATPYADGWILLNSDAAFPAGVLEKFYSTCRPDIIQTAGIPAWCCVWVGADVVANVGLFCESFHPAYYEDWDFERRAKRHFVEVVHFEGTIIHDGMSTVRSDNRLRTANKATFLRNKELYEHRLAQNADGAGEWDLKRVRELGWI